MSTHPGAATILMAEDDPDDRLLVGEAVVEAHLHGEVRFVGDGEELMDYLRARGGWAPPGAAPRPALILLDLNMPRKDGREALREIKADPELRRIPVVVLSTSSDDVDVVRCYDLGANSYVTKPATFDGLVRAMSALGTWWFGVARLPANGEAPDA
jgi:CheY-like chemotaxis protein